MVGAQAALLLITLIALPLNKITFMEQQSSTHQLPKLLAD